MKQNELLDKQDDEVASLDRTVRKEETEVISSSRGGEFVLQPMLNLSVRLQRMRLFQLVIK